MMRKKLEVIRGQVSLEFALFILCVIAALVGMRAYISRGMQGSMKGAADSMGEQYDTTKTTGDTTLTLNSTSNTIVNTTEKDGVTKTTTNAISNETQVNSLNWTIAP